MIWYDMIWYDMIWYDMHGQENINAFIQVKRIGSQWVMFQAPLKMYICNVISIFIFKVLKYMLWLWEQPFMDINQRNVMWNNQNTSNEIKT